MKIKQLSVFLENKAGKLCEITKSLAVEEINLLALNIAETSDYGVLRIITDNTEKTEKILKKNGFIVSITEVIAVAVNHKPGALNSVLEIAEKNNINIEYMYSAYAGKNGCTYMVFKVKNIDGFISVIRECGFRVLNQEDLY